jgi:mitotic spindle assembly checkpoint protein MAD2
VLGLRGASPPASSFALSLTAPPNKNQNKTEWLSRGELERLVLIIASAATRETLERWTFEVETCVDVRAQRAAERKAAGSSSLLGGAGAPAQQASASAAAAPLPEKLEREITAEIQAIIRQITASVTFLPLLEEPCTFDLLVYTKRTAALGGGGAGGEEAAAEAAAAEEGGGGLVPIPADWEESDPRYVAPGCAADVRLRSFSTKVHKVDTAVTYRASDD